MSTNNVNIVNTNNWYQKMNTIGTQNVTNMVLSGTNPSTQMALISVANDVHYCYSNYALQKTNGFTLTFQFYITGTSMNSICAYFGVTDPTTGFDANGGLANQSGAVELMIRPGGFGGGQNRFNLYTNYGSNTIAATNGTSITTGTWQTVTITYTPSSVGTWVVNYNGSNIISYNDTSYTTFVNNQNTVWGIYGATGGSSGASIRAVDLGVKQSMPMSVLKNTYSFYPEECFINELSTYSQTNLGAAFGLRLLRSDYLGPIINVRRGSDNATLDFYADPKGNIGTNLYGNGQTLLGWLAGSIGYVTRWYDQSGNGRDVIQATNANQPKIGTPILDTMSSSGKSAARGAYALYSTNSSYTGATIRLRRSSDSATSDFYADVYGNLNNSLSAENSVNTWTAITSNLACQGIAWSPTLNLFAATNYNGGAATTSAIQTSPDGITWTTRTTPSIATLSYIIWAPERSLFVATSYQAGTSGVLTSPDGINWTQRTTPNIADGISAGLHDLAWSSQLSLFVCVNQRTTANTNWVITSPDGFTWTQRTTPSGSNWLSVCWSPRLSLFVAVNNLIPTTSGVATSPDGITWTIRTTPSVSQLSRVRWSPELNIFAAVGLNSCITSPDGINWTSRTVPSGQWGGLVWSSELSIFASTRMDLSTNCIMTSPDGITWTYRTTPSTRCWDITWSPSLSTFVAVNPLSTTLITSAQGLIANSTFSSWISTSTAYVDTWYDQSGSGNHATQSTTAAQPVYNGTLKLLDFSSSRYFTINNTSVLPSGNNAFTFVAKHGTFSNGGVIIGNNYTGNRTNSSLLINTSNYTITSGGNDSSFGTNPVNGNTVVFSFNGTNKYGYVNNTLVGIVGGSYNVTASTTTIGYNSTYGSYLNGQLYNLFIFGAALSDSDRMACTGNPTDLNIKYDGNQRLYAGSTNYPLTSGLDTYTYVADMRVDDISTYRDIVSSGPKTSNVRASLLVYPSGDYGFYGFCGESNDTAPILTSTFVKRRIVMMCNHNLNTGNIVINDNGTIYTGTTNNPSALNVGSGFRIGANGNFTENFVGHINEIIVFRNTLTAKESMLYFTPNAITRKAYRSQPRLQIKDVPKDIGDIPSGAVVAIDTQMLANMSPGGLVTSWNGVTGLNSPVINAAISGTGTALTFPPYVSLTNNNVSASLSTGQYLNAGSKTFNINTNGGFTAIWYGAFTGSANNYERIFDFGSGTPSNNIVAYRGGTTSNIQFSAWNGTTLVFDVIANGIITQNEWAVWTFRHTTSSRLTQIFKNGIAYSGGTASQALTNRTLSNTWIGRSAWGSDTYSSMNMSGLYVYDSSLTDTQVASISNHLMYPTTSTMPSALPDYNNKVVRYGHILSQGFRNGQAMLFKGVDTTSYLDIQDVPNWPLTFCFWFNHVNIYGFTSMTIAGLCSADLAGNGIQLDMTSPTTLAPVYHNGSNWVEFTTQTVALNTWHHVAFTITPTTISFYLNGSLVQTLTGVVYNTNRLVIGKSGDNARPFNGYIADVRIFDYALRADEINAMVDSSGEERALTNYNAPTNYLVNMSNWPNIMNLYKSGGYTIYTAGSGTNVFYQLTSNANTNSSNTIFNSTRVQNYNSFTCAFDITIDNPNGDGFYFYCGATSSTTVPTGTAGTSANSGYYFYFKIAATRGIYLYNDQGQQLAYSPLPNVITNSRFVPITIVYNRSTTNTWTVNVASNDILTYNDPNNTNWVANIAGDFWGIGARTTSNTMFLYIRRVELSYTPFVNTINNTVNAQNNTKFPPGAMTAESTTFTGTGVLDGVYSLTASSANNPIYYAFDNNTGSAWGYPTGVFGGANGSYTGPWSHTVTNLITGTSAVYTGSWIQIQVPNPLTLNSFGLMGRQDQSLYIWRTPNTFYIAGSNDGSSWELIHSTSGAQFTSATQYFTCNAGNTNKYKYFRLIVNKIGNNGPSGDPGGNNYLEIAAWDLYTQMNTVNAAVIAVPPYSMTANTTTFSGNSVYDGTYTLTASNTQGTFGGDIYTAFNDTYGNTSNIWGAGEYYNTNTGVYTGSVSTTVSGVTQSGVWVQIQIPNPIVLYSFSLNFWWTDCNYVARSFLIAASNDAITWTNIYDNTNITTFVYGTAQTFVVTGSPIAYKYFRLIVRRVGKYDNATTANNVNGAYYQSWWFLDQWKLYTNASNFNLMKFPPAPLTADTPVTFTTVNQKNWYNIMNYGTTSWYSPVLSGTDPLVQLQLTPGSGGVGTYCNIGNQPVMNYSSFSFSFQLYCANTNNGDWIQLYFGAGGYQVTFSFDIYYYRGIRMYTTNGGNVASSATEWWNSTWNDIRVEYVRGSTNTWTMFFNETQIIQYSDPNWANAPGGTWGFQTFNGAAHFSSFIRQLEMTIAPVSLPGTSVVSGSYTASASSFWDINSLPCYAFGNNIWNASNYGMWHSGPVSYTNGAYTANTYTTTVSGTSYSGEWLQLQAPNPVQLVSFSICPRPDQSLFQRRSPRNFVMAGSNNGSTWDLLHTATGISDWTAADKYFVCNGSNVANKYSYFRLVVMAVGNPNPGTGDFVNIQNLSLFTPITLNNSITPATPKGLLDGLTWKYYNGSSNNSVSYYTTNTYTNIGRCIDTTNLNTITNGQHRVDGADGYSMELFGYFRATVSGTWTFSLATDDGSYLWIGANALTGYTTSNANIQHPIYNSFTPITCTVTLLAGNYYPIRIHFYEGGGGDDLRFRFTPPGGTQTSNGQGYFFSGTGLDSAFPQESAKIIKDLTNTNKDGVYYILVNGISTPIHCLMNDCYDGGGWMMLMKGTRGTTFQYSSNYWTRKNTLNAGDTTRSDADAKYDTFNYSTVKDVLAIWPDIPSRSYTNIYGNNGGSIFVDDGWTWLLNNCNETTRVTPLTRFTTNTYIHQNSLSAFQTYGINNPFRYNGYGTWCSSQSGSYAHMFAGGGNRTVRWGFIFNNETNDWASCDAHVGIGSGGTNDASAGDFYGCCGTAGINRTARFELYGR